jgi:hypothetical protein
MELILGFSLGVNILFIGLWIIGWRMDKEQTSPKMMNTILNDKSNWKFKA